MFDLVSQLLVQEIECLPAIFGIYCIFSLTKDLLFRES